jgi:hypothetical protein
MIRVYYILQQKLPNTQVFLFLPGYRLLWPALKDFKEVLDLMGLMGLLGLMED